MPPVDRWTRAADPGRIHRALVLVTIAGAVVVGALHLTRGHDWGDDFASYVMQAQGLWKGDARGFVEHNSLTILQSSHRLGPVAYPWGYPLLLVPPYAVAGLDPLVLKLPGLLLFAAFLVTLYLLARTGLDRVESLLVLVLFAFHPQLLAFLDHLLSDVPFLFLSTLALLLLLRLVSRPRAGAAQGALVGAVVFAAFLTRTVGLLLLGPLVLVQAWSAWRSRSTGWRDGWTPLPILAALLAFGMLWAGARLAFPDGQMSYVSQLAGVSSSSAWGNAGLYLRDAGVFFTGGNSHPWVLGALLLVVGVGAAHRRREDATLVVYLAASVLVVCAWPEHQGLRFLFPVLPLLAYFAVVGMRRVVSLAPPLFREPTVVAACACWIAVVGIRHASAGRGQGEGETRGGPFAERSLELFRYVREDTPPGSVIVFFKPRAMRLMTGRDAIQATDCAHLRRGDYVVLHRTPGRQDELSREGLCACGVSPEVVFENGDFVAHRLRSR